MTVLTERRAPLPPAGWSPVVESPVAVGPLPPQPRRRDREPWQWVLALALVLALVLLVVRPWSGPPPKPLWVFRGEVTLPGPSGARPAMVSVHTSMGLTCAPGGVAGGSFDVDARYPVSDDMSTVVMSGSWRSSTGSQGCRGALTFVPSSAYRTIDRTVSLRVRVLPGGHRVVDATYPVPGGATVHQTYTFADVPAGQFRLGPPYVSVG